MGKTDPLFIEKGVKIDTDAYLEMVKSGYLPDMTMIARGDDFVFMQDGAPSHTSKKTMTWLKDNMSAVLPAWPPSSCDLNPLDYSIWSILESKVAEMEPKTELDLRCAVKQACRNLDQDVVRRAIDQFVPRLKHCVAAGGAQFEYTMK